MGGCMGVWSFMIYWDTPTYGWVVGWSVGHVKSLKSNLDLIKIIQLFLMIYDLWVVGLVNGLSQITSNRINLDLIEIIQFCLQIYDQWRYLHGHTTHCSQSLGIEIMSLIYSPTVLTLPIDIFCITTNFGHSFETVINLYKLGGQNIWEVKLNMVYEDSMW